MIEDVERPAVFCMQITGGFFLKFVLSKMIDILLSGCQLDSFDKMPWFRSGAVGRRRFRFVIAALFILILFSGVNIVSAADAGALEQLLELFEKKGAVTSEEAAKIRLTIQQDRDRLKGKEKAVEEKERALLKKEKELTEKEKALKKKEQALFQEQKPSGTDKPPEEKGPEMALTSSPAESAVVEKESDEFSLKARYDDGFRLTSPENNNYSVRIGGLLQTDYRYFDYKNGTDPEKNRFDIRRARLIIKGDFFDRFSYKFQYGFQGAGSRRLRDAYVDTRILPYFKVRIGQFKTPFGFEQYSSDRNIPFAERSMGFLLTPLRDVGLMAHGSVWNDRFNYGLGIFNGDGLDDAVGGDVDSPELVGRVVLSPFRNLDVSLGEGFQFGGSFSYANVDRNNVNIIDKTTGLTTFFEVNARTKFNIIREAKTQKRYGVEAAWCYGPVLAWGEYVNLQYSDVQTSSAQFDINIKEYYGALLWMVTGERPSMKNGKLQAIRPDRNLWQGGWGALGLAFRYDVFNGGDSAYEYLFEPPNSVQKATAYTIALNWYLNPYVKLLIDATRTDFDRPLLIDKDPLSGEVIKSDREDVFTGRFQLQF